VADSAIVSLAGHGDAAAQPKYRQVYDRIRQMILDGHLPAGSRLPASRLLAGDLQVSRNTVVAAFDQLTAEGYLEARRGAGTFVSGELPDVGPAGPADLHPAGEGLVPHLSRRGEVLTRTRRVGSRSVLPFATGMPALDVFPFDVWSRLLARSWRRPPAELAVIRDPGGYEPLRNAIARYLAAARGVRAEPRQVIITAGAQQAIHLAAQMLLDPGDAALIEEPGYGGVRGALTAAAAHAVPVPVDEEGMMIDRGADLAPHARMALIAPSHQHPLGMVMSLPRRLEMLDWAARTGAWILEDDYDSEYRYAGRPLAALQGLDPAGRVIYVGSFSMVMYPTLRLGYLVVPPALVEPFLQARGVLDDHASQMAQPALAEFIDAGHFAAHLRRMRKLYAQRQQSLLAAADEHLAGLLTLAPDDSGLHLIGELAPAVASRMSDAEAAGRAGKAGVVVRPLSAFYVGAPARQGLVLGYAGFDPGRIQAAARSLGAALRA
jgi:GntR family transcriptional regulator/MocR family aminotransferase